MGRLEVLRPVAPLARATAARPAAGDPPALAARAQGGRPVARRCTPARPRDPAGLGQAVERAGRPRLPGVTPAVAYRDERMACLATGLAWAPAGMLLGALPALGTGVLAEVVAAHAVLVVAWGALLSGSYPLLKLSELVMSADWEDRVRFLPLLEDAADRGVLLRAAVGYEIRDEAVRARLIASGRAAARGPCEPTGPSAGPRGRPDRPRQAPDTSGADAGRRGPHGGRDRGRGRRLRHLHRGARRRRGAPWQRPGRLAPLPRQRADRRGGGRARRRRHVLAAFPRGRHQRDDPELYAATVHVALGCPWRRWPWARSRC